MAGRIIKTLILAPKPMNMNQNPKTPKPQNPEKICYEF